MPFHETGDVRIRYEDTGRSFPLWRCSAAVEFRISNWPTAVFNAMEAFKEDFRCITMVRRKVTRGTVA